MQLKHIAAAVALVAGSTAYAATTDLGPIDFSTEAVLAFPVTTPFFLDSYTFSLTNATTVFGDLDALGPISNFTVALADSTSAIIGSDLSPSDGFSFSGLTAGAYTLSVVGFATGPAAYGGFISAVPEPETYAMMLAGLAAMGFMASRRRNNQV